MDEIQYTFGFENLTRFVLTIMFECPVALYRGSEVAIGVRPRCGGYRVKAVETESSTLSKCASGQVCKWASVHTVQVCN